MDELTIGDKTYISTKKAAAITGYAKDYVGQLCREGRVEAKLVGRSWYVLEDSVREHRFGSEQSTEAYSEGNMTGMIGEESVITEEKVEEVPVDTASVIESTWEAPTYAPEMPVQVPELAKEEAPTPVETHEPISEMQNAWKAWFDGRHTEPANAFDRQETTKEEIEEYMAETLDKSEGKIEVKIEKEAPIRTVERISPAPAAAYDIYPMRESFEVEEKPARVVEERRKTRVKPNLSLIRPFLIATIILSIAITLVSIGSFNSIVGTGVERSSILNFFEGTSVLER